MLTSNPNLIFGFTYLNIHHLSILTSPVPTPDLTLDVLMLPVPSNPVNTRYQTNRLLQKKISRTTSKSPITAKCCRAEEECCAFICSGGRLGFLLSAVLPVGCASHCRPPSVASSQTILTISMGLGQTYLVPTLFTSSNLLQHVPDKPSAKR